MLQANLSIFSDFNQFTGFEHTRIIVMLTVLALISLIVWTIIGLSIIACHIALLVIRLSNTNKKRGAHAH